MSIYNQVLEWYYWVFNTPYYRVTVVKDMEVIKSIIQKVTTMQKGKDIAIIDTKLKCAWWTMPEVCFRSGKKFIMYVDIENAVPLVEDIKVITTGDIFIKEISIRRLTNASLKLGDIEKSGKAKRFVEIYFPPTLLFEKIHSHFVKETIADPPSIWEEKKEAIIAVCIAAVVIVYLILNSGVLNHIGAA
jgi:hypothetical protein